MAIQVCPLCGLEVMDYDQITGTNTFKCNAVFELATGNQISMCEVAQFDDKTKGWQLKPTKQEIAKLGTVVQIMPDHELCAGVLAMVVNTKAWGVEALILVPVRRGEVPKELYIRLEWGHFEIIGESPFQPEIIEPQLIITPPSVRGS